MIFPLSFRVIIKWSRWSLFAQIFVDNLCISLHGIACFWAIVNVTNDSKKNYHYLLGGKARTYLHPAPPLFEALSHFLLLLMSWWKSVFVFKKYIVHFFLCYTGNWKQQKSSKKSKQMKACEPLIMENKEKTILSLAGCCNDDMMTFTYINISLSFFPPLWETFSAFSQTIDRKLVFRFHLYSRKRTADVDINQFC